MIGEGKSLKTDLVVGKGYKLTLDDCCIGGEIFGTFLGYKYDYKDDEYPDAKFDIGIFWTFNGITFEEVNEQNT